MSNLWTRLRDARLVRLLLVYGAACWPALQFTAFVRDEFGLPRWLVPGMIILLVLGALVLVATYWVQSQPLTKRRALAEEVPDTWEVDLADAGESVAHGRLPHLTWARAAIAGVVGLALLFGLAGVFVLLREREPDLGASEAVASEAAPALAVLPFSVSGAGTADLREGMVDLLSTNLDGVTGLRTIDSRTVLSRWAARGNDAERVELAAALDVARETGARWALIGSAVGVGSQVRLIADVYDVRTGAKLGQGQVEGPPDRILPLVDQLSVEVLREILAAQNTPDSPESVPEVDLARVTTSSLPALKSFLQGEAMLRHSRFAEAIERFRAAVEADSTFALAWYRLGTSRGWLEGLSDEHIQDFERAARLAERLPSRERLLLRAGLALARNDPAAVELAEEAVSEYPEDAEAWYLLGDVQFHLGFHRLLPRGTSAEAFRKALQLDQAFAPAYIHLLQTVMFADDSAGVAQLLPKFHAVAAGSPYDVAARLAYEALWGGMDTVAVKGAVDTVDPGALGAFAGFLQQPRGLRHMAAALHEMREMPYPAAQVGGTIGLAWNAVSRGRARELQAVLADPHLPEDTRRDIVLQAALMELPLPPELMDASLSLAAVDTNDAADVLQAGAYAALRNRPEEQHRARETLERLRDRRSAERDTVGAGSAEAMIRTLQGLELLTRDRPDEAVTLLEATRRSAFGSEERQGLALALTYILGETLVQLGRPADGLPYLLAFPFPTPVLYFQLARAYESQQRFPEARHAYEQFVLGWRDADPELQPRVQEARAAIQRLSSAVRE